MSELPILDPSHLLSLLSIAPGESDPVLAELIGIFENDVPGRLEQLRTLIDGGEWAEVAAAAHGLRGGSGNLGLQRFSEAARQIELAAQRGEHGLIPGQFKVLAEGYEVALAALKKSFL